VKLQQKNFYFFAKILRRNELKGDTSVSKSIFFIKFHFPITNFAAFDPTQKKGHPKCEANRIWSNPLLNF